MSCTVPLRPARRPTRTGFTIVELLVVIAIIGILVALLLPAVQAARESARRMQCGNNLKQLALAALNYADTFGAFPPASSWPRLDPPTPPSNMGRPGAIDFERNWILLILPFMEQQTIHDSFDFSKPIPDPANATPRGTRIPTLLCPSDRFNRDVFNGTKSSGTTVYGDGWERNNYGANGGLGYFSDVAHCTNTFPPCTGRPQFWKRPWVQGVMGPNITTRLTDIRDGTSHTFLILEIRSGVKEFDIRGVWAMPGAGPSAVGGHGTKWANVRGPNQGGDGGDDIPSCQAVKDAVGGAANLARMGMGCYQTTDDRDPNRQAAARSLHVDGIQVAMCDGSVQYIEDFIDVNTQWSSIKGDSPVDWVPSVWDRLNLSTDGFPVGADAF